MKERSYRWILPLVLAFVFPVLVVGDVGDPLTLVVEPNTPVGGGDTISLTLSEGTEGDIAFLFFGTELGQFPIHELTLDLIPFFLIPLGFFDENGTVAFDIQLPADLPPEVSGTIMYLQAASLGIDWVPPDPPTFMLRQSDLDQIEFE